MGCSLWGRKESDTTERLPFHFSLSRIGEGNGSPLQCSCLENPRDGGAWWAAVYGVAQSRTWLSDWTELNWRFPCVYVPHTHPLFCWRTFRLLPCLGCYKQYCSEHWGACILLDHLAISGFNKPLLIQNPINYLLITWLPFINNLLTIDARIYCVFKLKVELTLYTMQIAEFFSWILDEH